MVADRGLGEVDGRSAVGTVDHRDVLAQFPELFGRQWSDEVLLSQKVDEGGEASVPGVAAIVLKRSVALPVVGQKKARLALRAMGRARECGRCFRRPRGDQAEDLQRRGGCEMNRF